MNEYRERHHKPSVNLEPLHLIILGLAVALGGVVWQWQRGQSSAVTTADSPQQNATAAPPASSPTDPFSAALDLPKGNAADRSTRLMALGEALKLIQDGLEPTAAQGKKLVSKWSIVLSGSEAQSSYANEWNNLRGQLRTQYEVMVNVHNKYPQFEDVQLLTAWPKSKYDGISLSLLRFQEASATIGVLAGNRQTAESTVRNLITPFQKDAESQLSECANFLAQARSALVRRYRQLSD